MLDLILLALATWRITALFVYDEGPGDVFVKLRELSDAKGGPLNCFWCTSVWSGLLASLFFCPPPRILWWWALSGAAVIIDEAVFEET